MSEGLEERSVGGLHGFVVDSVIPRWRSSPSSAIDLGAGSGALAKRLAIAGWDVVAVERDVAGFRADLPVVEWDLDEQGLDARLGPRRFSLVIATEVIEHVESPIGFLRLVAALLDDPGIAIVTTPNVDNALARVKFLARDRLRMMDEAGDPTHISPIFLDLLTRQYLPRVGLRLVERRCFPPGGFAVSRRWVAMLGRTLAWLLPGLANIGDNHVLVLAHEDRSKRRALS